MSIKEAEAIILSQPIVLRKEVVGNSRLSYTLFKRSVLVENHQVCLYGIEINSTLFGDEEIGTIEDVSTDFELMTNLFELLMENLVLPSTMKDIIHDYIADATSIY